MEQSLAEGDEKKKQQRRARKKSKLEDMFPAYLQAGSDARARRAGALSTAPGNYSSDSACRKPSLERNCWT